MLTLIPPAIVRLESRRDTLPLPPSASKFKVDAIDSVAAAVNWPRELTVNVGI